MPWDDHISQPTYVTNRAITIDASPQVVWPWLAQMGELPRGGFYSYDWIEQLMGMKVSSAARLFPRPNARGIGLLLVLDPGQFLMERRMLLGIKQRAERARSR